MRIFNGKNKANKILLEIKRRIVKEKIMPILAVISVGKDSASELFIRNKKREAERIGIEVKHFKFKRTVQEEELLNKIKKLNHDFFVNGIIVQLPLPLKLKTKKIVGQIFPVKDVDGFHSKSKFSSPLISAILIALKDSIKNFKNKKIVALVNSDFFGKAIKSSLKKEGIKVDYLKNEKSPKISKADIIITVCGKPGLIKGDMIKKGAVLIDGGIAVIKNRKAVVGDMDRESVEEKAVFLTPVPGGLGPMTVALLLKNVYLSAKKYGNSKNYRSNVS